MDQNPQQRFDSYNKKKYIDICFIFRFHQVDHLRDNDVVDGHVEALGVMMARLKLVHVYITLILKFQLSNLLIAHMMIR